MSKETQADRRREDEAARWAARRLGGPASAREERAFEAWMRDEANADAYRAFEQASGALDHAADDLLAEALAEDLEDFTRETERRRRPLVLGAMAMAASLVAAVVVTLGVFVDLNGVSEPAHYATALGERRTVTLEDGSRVALNTDSAVEVVYSRAARSVEFSSGEAMFDVERDETRPFRVATAFGAVEVLGTSFNIRADARETVISVVSGRVRATGADGRDVVLGAGDRLVLNVNGSSPVTRFDADRLLAWRRGVARFEARPLSEVTAELNRYFDPPILVGDSSLRDFPVTGEFDLNDRETAIRGLSLAFGLDVLETDAGAVLVRGPALKD